MSRQQEKKLKKIVPPDGKDIQKKCPAKRKRNSKKQKKTEGKLVNLVLLNGKEIQNNLRRRIFQSCLTKRKRNSKQ